MATTTPNFGWDIPQSTDLVKDGATAIAALGTDIDTSLVDLKGGTTGQVLSKNSNTDMDFTWVAQDDSNAIQNAIVDAKGDLITATAADTPARLAVGSNDQVLTADSSTATGLKWATPSSGGMTLISTTSLSGSTITLSSIPSTYVHLQLVVTNYLPATTNTPLKLRFNGDTNTRYKDGTSTTNNSQAFNASSIDLFAYQNNTASDGLMIVDIYDYTNTTTWKFTSTQVIWNNNTTPANSDMYRIFGMYNQTGAISSITLFPNSGNYTSGSVKLYGVK